ncbi:hypothetical protein EVAR_49870_1 [Eumeta japonica]|uniref:ATP-dependent DNA helicase n=1 Tax=Eumeta variegata TaxID=151549 RepID=A0A4C1XXV9_EUMVA|nr:hypothetical protein EVAR_49870_1 [Eumeta japonica]
MISERLNFIKRNQKKLRAEDYIHLRDAVVNDGHLNASNIGQHVILPSSFTGSPRFMNEKSQDAMTYVRKFGRPDLFITFTCNTEWPEIKNKSLTDFGLPAAKRNNSLLDPLEVALRKPYNLNDLNEYITENEPRLVNDQVTTYNCVMKSVSFNEGKIFFLDAPGGTGKTFITNLILAKVRSLGKLALAVASSGIAATLLAGGRTAHSTFKLP